MTKNRQKGTNQCLAQSSVKRDVRGSQLSVSQPVHVLDVQRQLVLHRLVSVLLVPALSLQGEQLEKHTKTLSEK